MKYLFTDFSVTFKHVFVFLKIKALPSILYSLLNQNTIDESLYHKYKSKFGRYLGNMIRNKNKFKDLFQIIYSF